MTERDALLAAIRANPEDDTPRLAFADWLDEYEPDAKSRRKKGAAPSSWAALIRAECEFERLRNSGSAAAAVYAFFDDEDRNAFDGVRWERALPGVGRLVELLLLIPKLRRASGKARKAGLPKVGRGLTWPDDTHRGFPAALRVMSGSALLRQLPDLLASTPPVQVLFSSFPLPEAEELVATGLGRWCRALYAPADEDHAPLVGALARSSDAAGVRELSLGWAGASFDRDILEALAESPRWSGLRSLDFEGTALGEGDGQARLLASPAARNLRRLSAHSANWTAETVAALGNLTELRELWLPHGNFDDDLAEHLASLPGLANLRLLNLKNNRITGRGATALLASRHLKSLTVLDLEGNPVRGLNKAALAKAPAGGLRALNLQSSRLTVADLAAVVSGPRSSELLYFAACHNNFPESAVARMVKAFGGRAPAILYFMDNNVSTAGAQALAKWPAAERIDMLHLSSNPLSVTGARAIAGCPHLQKLNHLCAGAARPAARAALMECFGDRADV